MSDRRAVVTRLFGSAVHGDSAGECEWLPSGEWRCRPFCEIGIRNRALDALIAEERRQVVENLPCYGAWSAANGSCPNGGLCPVCKEREKQMQRKEAD